MYQLYYAMLCYICVAQKCTVEKSELEEHFYMKLVFVWLECANYQSLLCFFWQFDKNCLFFFVQLFRLHIKKNLNVLVLYVFLCAMINFFKCISKI